ncbi:hypothetical protein OG203_05620 [Nocardia sp. NBC_01499]|uniref:hypothetical protein n=1 Tax=Nocardia sp. NBC_01499 TaxID=2903597 RepID=UPI003867530F
MIVIAAMTALVLISLCAMAIDDRTILGESVWLKPLEFGFAFASYGTTLAWLLMLPHNTATDPSTRSGNGCSSPPDRA